MFSSKALLSFVVSVLLLAQTCTSLFVSSLNKRVVNGFIMQQEFSPGAVGVINDVGEYLLFAGGTLLSTKHVLTAGHGVRQLDNKPSPPQNVIFVYGSNNKNNQILNKIKKVTVMPEYLKYHNGTYGIAILEMDEIKFSETAQRAPIYNGPISEGQALLTLGWGKTEKGAKNLERLRQR